MRGYTIVLIAASLSADVLLTSRRLLRSGETIARVSGAALVRFGSRPLRMALVFGSVRTTNELEARRIDLQERPFETVCDRRGDGDSPEHVNG